MGKDRMRLQVSGLSACSIVFGAFAQQRLNNAMTPGLCLFSLRSYAVASWSGLIMAASSCMRHPSMRRNIGSS